MQFLMKRHTRNGIFTVKGRLKNTSAPSCATYLYIEILIWFYFYFCTFAYFKCIIEVMIE